MFRRKIQLIAGTTYSVSLPKEWVKKNKLKEQEEVIMIEKNNRTLVLSPHEVDDKKISEITLNVDEYTSNIGQILFAVYYLGVENIKLISKKEISKETRTAIRKTLVHMSGTEISYEDSQKIYLRVLLDKSKIEISQLIYRTGLLIELSISNILGEMNIDEIRINENEIDRLYHLMAKIISLSLIDSNVLNSSGIGNVSFIPGYFLIGKKLENIGDNIKHLSEYIHKNKKEFEHRKELLSFLKEEIGGSINHIMQRFPNVYKKADIKDIEHMKELSMKVKDMAISDYLRESIRFLDDIEREIVNISFYNKLSKEKSL